LPEAPNNLDFLEDSENEEWRMGRFWFLWRYWGMNNDDFINFLFLIFIIGIYLLIIPFLHYRLTGQI
jgi:hypothetical protein